MDIVFVSKARQIIFILSHMYCINIGYTVMYEMVQKYLRFEVDESWVNGTSLIR